MKKTDLHKKVAKAKKLNKKLLNMEDEVRKLECRLEDLQKFRDKVINVDNTENLLEECNILNIVTEERYSNLRVFKSSEILDFGSDDIFGSSFGGNTKYRELIPLTVDKDVLIGILDKNIKRIQKELKVAEDEMHEIKDKLENIIK